MTIEHVQNLVLGSGVAGKILAVVPDNLAGGSRSWPMSA